MDAPQVMPKRGPGRPRKVLQDVTNQPAAGAIPSTAHVQVQPGAHPLGSRLATALVVPP